jgi:purine-binding chemotaxis protein CheW
MKLIPIYLNNNIYAIEVNFVIEIIPIIKIIDNLKKNNPLVGVINYRGEIVSLLDFKKIITNEFSDKLLNTRIVIIKANKKFGLIVENLTDIIEINNNNIINENINQSHLIKKYVNYLGNVVSIINLNSFDNFLISNE